MLTPSLTQSQSALSGKVTPAPDAGEQSPCSRGLLCHRQCGSHFWMCVCHKQAHAGKLHRALSIFQAPEQSSSSNSSGNASNDPVCEWGVWSCREAGTAMGIARRGSISQQESHPGSLISKNQLVNSLEHPVHICNAQQLMRHSCIYKITNSVLFIYITDWALCRWLGRGKTRLSLRYKIRECWHCKVAYLSCWIGSGYGFNLMSEVLGVVINGLKGPNL